MRAVLLRSLLVIGAGALVLAGVLYVASTVDARPPTVLEIGVTQALPDDPNVALLTTSIEITFSEPVDAAGAADAISLEPAVEGSVSPSGSTLFFTPAEPLELETAYTVAVAPGIRDLAGNEMTEVPAPYEFVTAGRPTLAGSEPADGADAVPVDAVIALVFSGLMDTATVEAALDVEPAFGHEIRWSGERLEIVPSEPLEPGGEYTVRVADSATDIAGVALEEPVTIGFRTVDAGLSIDRLIPADGSGGISPRTQIAVAFDRPVDPESLDADPLVLTPDVPGTLDLVGTPDAPESTRLLVFTPSAPLPPNTTFDVQLAAGVAGTGGDSLAEPVTWTFTTGAPQSTLSNRVLFISDRSGIANVWAMNPDGTGQHQISAELIPVIEYAAAPDGSSLVVGDGRRLVYLRADGSERQVLTEPAHLEFDATYAPGGGRIAFARADAASGELLGLWEWELEGGLASEIELPDADRATPDASPTGDGAPTMVRAPSFSPDGGALAFVDVGAGQIGIADLDEDELTTVEAVAAGPPAWTPSSDAILVPVAEGPPDGGVSAPVGPLMADGAVGLMLIDRADGAVEEVPLAGGVRQLVAGANGRIAWISADGTAHVAQSPGAPGTVPDAVADVTISELTFGPLEDVVLVVIGDEESTMRRVQRVDLESGQRQPLATDGWEVRWLP